MAPEDGYTWFQKAEFVLGVLVIGAYVGGWWSADTAAPLLAILLIGVLLDDLRRRYFGE